MMIMSETAMLRWMMNLLQGAAKFHKVGFSSNAKKSELLNNLLVTVSNMESRVIILHTGIWTQASFTC